MNAATALWRRIRASRAGLAALIALAAVPVLLGAGLWFWLAGEGGTAAGPRPTPRPTLTVSPSPAPTPTRRPSHRPSPSPSPSPTPTPAPEGLADDRLTVLVLGSDSDSARRARGREPLTDAITVVSVAADASQVVLISLPRDSTDVPMPDGSTWTAKVNAVTALRGPGTMRDTMSLLLGLEIDHYVLIDMDDFRRVVDAVGGVTVSVPYQLSDTRCTIAAGARHLNGQLALCFARNRSTDSDYARAGRHQQLLLALRDRIAAGGTDLGALVGALSSLRTDMPLADVPAYADLLARTSDARVQRLVLSPPAYTTFVGTTTDRGWISVPNRPAIRAAVARAVGRE